ncbi:hypothetical protein [Natribaculum luteum]|nr:hypothetical protein [Natribaculum luteum]
MISKQVEPTASYQRFPAYFASGAIDGIVTGLPARSAYVIYGVSVALASMWLLAFLVRRTELLSKYNTVVPATLLPFLYKFNQSATYSIASTSYALLTMLPLAYVLYDLNSQRHFSLRHSIVLLVGVAYLNWLHKLAHIWLFGVVILVTFAYFFASGSDLTTLTKKKSLGIIAAYAVFVFWNSAARMSVIVVRIRALFGGAPTEVSNFGLLQSPVPLLLTFIGSSIILGLVIAGTIVILRNDSAVLNQNRVMWTTILTALIPLSTVYFPGPAYLLESIAAGLNLFRISRYGIPFVALISSIGLCALWQRSQVQRVVLALLLVTGGVVTASNDIYTRDNSLANTDAAMNYLTQEQYQAANWTWNHKLSAAMSQTVYSYYRGIEIAEWRVRPPDPRFITRDQQLCSVPLMVDGVLLDRRGHMVIEDNGQLSANHVIRDEHSINSSRSKLYTNGKMRVYSKC